MRLPVLCLALLLPAAASAATVTFSDGGHAAVETAATEAERQTVMEERGGINLNEGILIQYPPDRGSRTVPKAGFGTDLVFISEQGKILKIHPQVAAETETTGRGTFVLVLPNGTAALHALKVGDKVKISDLGSSPTQKDDQAQAKKEKKEPEQASAGDISRQMMDSIRSMRGTLPSDVYEKLEQMGLEMSRKMSANPNADPMLLLKDMTGMDVERINQLTAQARKRSPNLSEAEIVNLVAAQMATEADQKKKR